MDHLFAPCQRPYQGQAWVNLHEAGPASGRRLEIFALVELVDGDVDGRIVPQLSREHVDDLIARLAGTGHSAGNRHSDIACLQWADDNTHLVIVNRAGTAAERVVQVDADERGLYPVDLDAVTWAFADDAFTGLRVLERAYGRLAVSTAQRHPNPSSGVDPLAGQALAAVGEVLAEVLAEIRPHLAARGVIDAVGLVLARTARHLCAIGESEIAYALLHAVTMQPWQLRGPVAQQLDTAAVDVRQRYEIIDGSVVCTLCAQRTVVAQSVLRPQGWACRLCASRLQEVRG
ncbi:hypothetical protein [Catellatospora chokoriensis]|uniref:Uncharacterized protein n=1 Tax=Catellatospora chokoriensis TaxID=310353 RepID=A0A8J3JZM2_9ACTN|nr:hypothetical protein [Catellatospora chokoriensis]GIF94026.1 hypothetical protein Cch02nite_74700 [Catellatospora chokoriensis]